MARKVLLEFRRDTAANWTAANPILSAGEPGFETDTGKLKIGDGTTHWTSLAYIAPGVTGLSSPGGTITVTAPTGPTVDVDLPATGVAAGTYGDATHTSEITVDAEGRVTSASSVPISGASGAGGLIVLYENTLAANGASLDTGAGGIAAGHGDLFIYLYVRTNRAAAIQDNLNIILNADSAAHYDNERLQAGGATATATSSNAISTLGVGITCASATEAANVFSVIRLTIPSYDNTVGFKVAEIASITPSETGTNNLVQVHAALWRSTAAITRLGVTSATGANLLAGSRLVVYGMR